MKFQLTILMLLVAGASVGTSDGVVYGRKSFQRKYGFQCPPRNHWTKTTLAPCTSTSTSPTPTTSPPTSPPTEDPNGPCADCLNIKVTVYDTYATYTFPRRVNQRPCNCDYEEIRCGEGEVINRVTCIDGGSSIDGCVCIPATTTTTTTPYPSPVFG